MPLDLAWTIASFVVALGVLITFHEFGHFIVARACGVKILTFSVGFGRPLISVRRGADNTEFVLAALPLGGFVKMLDEREGEVPEGELARAFNRQSLGARSAIVLAGPLFNLMLAVLIYGVTYMVGVAGTRPLIGEVPAGSVADRAGIVSGDEILKVDGRSTPTWESVLNQILPAVVADRSPILEVDGAAGAREVVLDFHDQVDIDTISEGNLFEALGLGFARIEVPAVIGEVLPGEPADIAGLQSGDRILRVDGSPVADWFAFRERVLDAPGQTLDLEVQRGDRRIAAQIIPAPQSLAKPGLIARLLGRADPGPTVGRVGASPEPPPASAVAERTGVERLGPAAALVRGAQRTLETCAMTLQMLKKMLVGDASVKNLSGPLSIAQFAGESAALGLVPFLSFLALVSVSLGVLNLLPIPVLDGGHLVYYLIEFTLGKTASAWVEGYAQQLGLGILMALMGLAVFNDVNRLVFGG